jgi:hypothetical protein
LCARGRAAAQRHFFGPFYAYQAISCLSAPTYLLCLSGLFMLIIARNFVLCLSVFLMLIGAEYAAVNAYHCGKKLKSIYLETTDFSATVCPVGVFFPAKSRSVPFRFISLK